MSVMMGVYDHTVQALRRDEWSDGSRSVMMGVYDHTVQALRRYEWSDGIRSVMGVYDHTVQALRCYEWSGGGMSVIESTEASISDISLMLSTPFSSSLYTHTQTLWI